MYDTRSLFDTIQTNVKKEYLHTYITKQKPLTAFKVLDSNKLQHCINPHAYHDCCMYIYIYIHTQNNNS